MDMESSQLASLCRTHRHTLWVAQYVESRPVSGGSALIKIVSTFEIWLNDAQQAGLLQLPDDCDSAG